MNKFPINDDKKDNNNKKKKKDPKKEKEEEVVFHIKDISELIGRELQSAVNSKENIKKRN